MGTLRGYIFSLILQLHKVILKNKLMFMKHSDAVVMSIVEKPTRKLAILSSEHGLHRMQ